MKPATSYILLAALTSLLAEAAIIPQSVSDAASQLSKHSWRRKKKLELLGPGDYPKYFHEPKGYGTFRHYDRRYFHGQLNYVDRQDTQRHLMRSYLEYFYKNGMETWLAHGTLLGWWWNAHMLPWDGDMDTQVSVVTLNHLAENHNNTLYSYISKDTEINPVTKKEEPISRQYHLDVNPAFSTRLRNKGENVIDARWIDVRNGMYVDITGVAETEPKEAPGVWSCKNYHRYRTRDLWPMRESLYEEFVAKVPYAYERILSEEYGEKSLVVDEYEGHLWDSVDHVWVKKTPGQIKQHKLDQQAARRKKQEQKAEAMREKQSKEKDEAIAKEAKMQKLKQAGTNGTESTKDRAQEKRWLRKDCNPMMLVGKLVRRHLQRIDL